jgi:NAD(P)-dependent dehydrogenase (short-subunit alcohol dehydrogenase family)
MSATTPSAVQAGNLAVITGAGSGLGLELARLAARKGLTLALGDVQADALAAAEAELKGTGVEVFAERLDVSSAYEVEAFGAKVFERFGAPHLVFNNAGVGFGGFIWEHSVKD